MKSGLCLLQYEHRPDWIEIASVRPAALCIMDPEHFEAARLATKDGLVIWRPTEPAKPLWAHFTPQAWARYIVEHWPYPIAPEYLLPGPNEPNLDAEWGMGDGIKQAADRLNEWYPVLLAALRREWPTTKYLSPPMSPAQPHGNDLQFLEWSRPAVSAADVLAAHCYWATPDGLYNPAFRGEEAFRYRQYRQKFPALPIIVTECNRPANGMRIYGEELYDYACELDDYVQAMCAFCYDAPDGWFDQYRLRGTAALTRWAALIEENAAEFLCPACGAPLRIERA